MAKIKDLPKVNEELNINSSIYYLEYLNLLMNNLKIESTTNDIINFDEEKFAKYALLTKGAVGYDKITKKFYYVDGQGINEYGNPSNLILRTADGKTITRRAYYDKNLLGAYKINATPLQFSFGTLIYNTTKFMAQCDNAIYQNIEAIKTPYIVAVSDADTRLSIEQAIQQKQDGKPVIVVSNNIANDLKSININVDYVADKLEIIKGQYRDRLLNKLGIMSANIDKRERVQVGEVNTTINQASDYIYLLIDTFNKQCESYDLPFKMSCNGSIEELYLNNDTNIDNTNQMEENANE